MQNLIDRDCVFYYNISYGPTPEGQGGAFVYPLLLRFFTEKPPCAFKDAGRFLFYSSFSRNRATPSISFPPTTPVAMRFNSAAAFATA